MIESIEQGDISVAPIVETVSKIENIFLYTDRPHGYRAGDGLNWASDKSSIVIVLDLAKAISTPRSSRITKSLLVAFSLETIETALDEKSLTLTITLPKAAETIFILRNQLRSEVKNKCRAVLASAEQYIDEFFLPHLSPLEAQDMASELLTEVKLGTCNERKSQYRSPS